MRNTALLLLVIAGTLAIAIPLGNWNTNMRDRHGYAFPDLQDARSPERARRILDAWKDPAVREEIAKTMKLDLAFPFFYSPLIALIALRASDNARRRWLRTLGAALAVGALLGGVFDLLENATMLKMLASDDASRIGLVQAFGAPKSYLSMAASIYGLFAQFEPRQP